MCSVPASRLLVKRDPNNVIPWSFRYLQRLEVKCSHTAWACLAASASNFLDLAVLSDYVCITPRNLVESMLLPIQKTLQHFDSLLFSEVVLLLADCALSIKSVYTPCRWALFRKTLPELKEIDLELPGAICFCSRVRMCSF